MMFLKILHIPRRVLIFFVRIYQKTLSPDHGVLRHMFPYGYCKFHPSCSEYTAQALKKYGVLRGGAKATLRILRCNPCSLGGKDELR